MKNIIMMCVFLFIVTGAIAQEKKDTFVQKNDKIEATYYYDNGVIRQQGFFNLEGKLDGVWKMYNCKGQKIAMGNFENGKRTGKWFFWNTNKTLAEVDYVNHKIDKINVWEKSQLAFTE